MPGPPSGCPPLARPPRAAVRLAARRPRWRGIGPCLPHRASCQCNGHHRLLEGEAVAASISSSRSDHPHVCVHAKRWIKDTSGHNMPTAKNKTQPPMTRTRTGKATVTRRRAGRRPVARCFRHLVEGPGQIAGRATRISKTATSGRRTNPAAGGGIAPAALADAFAVHSSLQRMLAARIVGGQEPHHFREGTVLPHRRASHRMTTALSVHCQARAQPGRIRPTPM